MKINNILVPIDFSPCAINALSYATTLAQSFEAKITILNGYDIPVPVADLDLTYNPAIFDEYEAAIQKKFEQLKFDVPLLQEVPYEFKVKVAFPMEAIQNEVDNGEFDLVVMGTKGANNKFDELIGSNTYHIVKKSSCPVLIIPPDVINRDLYQIAVAIDLNQKELPSMEWVSMLAKFYNAKIHFLHVSKKANEIPFDQAWETLALKNEMEDISNEFHFIENEKSDEAIDNYLNTHAIDLLVLFPKKHSLYDQLFTKSVTRKLTLHPQTAILTLK